MTVRRFIECALAWQGVREDASHPRNWVPGLRCGWLSQGSPWCALWLSAVLAQARDYAEPQCSAASAWMFMERCEVLHWSLAPGAALRPGDVVYRDRLGASGTRIGGHVALVLGVLGEEVLVIAGNSGPQGDRVFIQFTRRAVWTRAARPFVEVGA